MQIILDKTLMNFISGIGGRRTGSHSAGKFTMTEYQSSRAEGLWSSPAPELRTLVSWESEYNTIFGEERPS